MRPSNFGGCTPNLRKPNLEMLTRQSHQTWSQFHKHFMSSFFYTQVFSQITVWFFWPQKWGKRWCLNLIKSFKSVNLIKLGAHLSVFKLYNNLLYNPRLFFQFVSNAQLFSRICGKDVHILEATSSFAEKAASIDSTSSVAMAEVGRQCLLRGRIKEAQKYYKVNLK